jgi:hypothetical protein
MKASGGTAILGERVADRLESRRLLRQASRRQSAECLPTRVRRAVTVSRGADRDPFRRLLPDFSPTGMWEPRRFQPQTTTGTTGALSKTPRFSTIFGVGLRSLANCHRHARMPMAIGSNRLFPTGNRGPTEPKVTGSNPVGCNDLRPDEQTFAHILPTSDSLDPDLALAHVWGGAT